MCVLTCTDKNSQKCVCYCLQTLIVWRSVLSKGGRRHMSLRRAQSYKTGSRRRTFASSSSRHGSNIRRPTSTVAGGPAADDGDPREGPSTTPWPMWPLVADASVTGTLRGVSLIDTMRYGQLLRRSASPVCVDRLATAGTTRPESTARDVNRSTTTDRGHERRPLKPTSVSVSNPSSTRRSANIAPICTLKHVLALVQYPNRCS